MGFADALKGNVTAGKAYRAHAAGNQLQNQGKLEESKQKHEEALTLYEEAVKLGCKKPQYILAYSILLLRAGKFERARELLLELNENKAITKDEKFQLRINYAVCQWKLGHLDTAIETMRRAERNAKTSTIYTTMGLFLIDKAVETGDFAQALAYNEEALDYDDEDAAILDNMAQLYLAMREKALRDGDGEAAALDRAKALEYLRKAYKRKETQVTTLYSLAQMDFEDGNLEEARTMIQAAGKNHMSEVCPVTTAMIDEMAKKIG